MSKIVYGDAARKLRADADLSEESVNKARLDRIKSVCAMLVSASAALGIFTVFCYCE